MIRGSLAALPVRLPLAACSGQQSALSPQGLNAEYIATLGGAMLAGTVGLFLFLVLLFIRFLPLFGIVEVRELLEEERLDVTPGTLNPEEAEYGRV